MRTVFGRSGRGREDRRKSGRPQQGATTARDLKTLSDAETNRAKILPALAALARSAIGGPTSFASTWLNQARQDRATRRSQDKARRRKLSKQFIDEASKLYADALVHDQAEVSELVSVQSLIGQMRFQNRAVVIDGAEAVVRTIVDSYFSPNKTFPERRKLIGSPAMSSSNTMEVVGDFLAFEPYALMYRKDDPDMSEAVRRAPAAMAVDGQLVQAYRRWFLARTPTGEELNLPMSLQLTEAFRSMGVEDF